MARANRLGLAIALLLAASDAGHAQDASAIDRGRQILEAHCARCHAIGASDTSPLAQAPALRQLRRKYPIDSLAEALAEGIVTGHPGMPEMAFPPADITAILTYLGSLPDPR